MNVTVAIWILVLTNCSIVLSCIPATSYKNKCNYIGNDIQILDNNDVKCDTYYDNSIFSNYRIVPIPNLSIEQCEKRCQNKTGCTHFTWSVKSKECLLKNTYSEEELSKSYKRDNDYVCGSLKKRLQKKMSVNKQVTKIEKCSYYGEDITNGMKPEGSSNPTCFDGVSYTDCEHRCINDKRCTHFYWNPRLECYLKAAYTEEEALSIERPSNGTCGVIKSRMNLGSRNITNRIADCDFINNDIKNPDGSLLVLDFQNVGQCEQNCYDNKNCTHFTWHVFNCTLKHSATHKEAQDSFASHDEGICGMFEHRFEDKSTNAKTKKEPTTATPSSKQAKGEKNDKKATGATAKTTKAAGKTVKTTKVKMQDVP